MASVAIPIPGSIPVSAATAAPKKNKFLTFLDAVGHDFKIGLDHVLPIASAVATGISVVNPALGGLMQTTVATILSIEQKFAAMGQQSGTGAQKGAQALAILYPAFESLFAQLGVKIDTSQVENYIAAIVAALNAFPPLPTQGASSSVLPVASAATAAATVIPKAPASVPNDDAVASAQSGG